MHLRVLACVHICAQFMLISRTSSYIFYSIFIDFIFLAFTQFSEKRWFIWTHKYLQFISVKVIKYTIIVWWTNKIILFYSIYSDINTKATIHTERHRNRLLKLIPDSRGTKWIFSNIDRKSGNTSSWLKRTYFPTKRNEIQKVYFVCIFHSLISKPASS